MWHCPSFKRTQVIGTEKVKPLEVARIESAMGAGIDSAYLYSRQTTFDNGRTVDTPRYAVRVGVDPASHRLATG